MVGYWADENLHWTSKGHSGCTKKSMLVGDSVRAPIYEKNLIGARYLEFLQEKLLV